MKKIKNKGFTLIEMLVVLMIIGILMGISIMSYGTLRDKARTTNANTTAKGLAEAWNLYLLANGYFPSNADFANANLTQNPTGWYVTDEKFVEWRRTFNPTFHFNISREEEAKKSKTGGTGFIDPWKNFYRFKLDPGLQNGTGMDGELDNPVTGDPIKTVVLVWSFGRDGEKGTTDDIVAW